MFQLLKSLIQSYGLNRSHGPRRPGTLAGATRAPLAFAESEEQFAKLVAGVRDYAVFLLDRHGCVATWNAGAERFKGYRAEEIIGQHFSRFYPNEAISSGWPAHELEVAAQTGRFEDEGWRVRKDGTRFWASVVITALRDENGEIRGYLKITRDLTDRKQAEEKLRLSEERFRLLVEGVSDYAIFMLDPQGRVSTWNAGAERLKGYPASEIIGQHFSKFYLPDAVARGWPEEKLRRAAAEGRVEEEGWRVRKDGSSFWAGVVLTALRDEQGTLRGFAKVTRDLTEKRIAEESTRKLLEEEAARKAAEAFAEEQQRQREQLHVTLASIGDAVVVTDGKGAVTFLNPIAAQLTGWEQAEAAGKPLEIVFRIINERTRQSVPNPVDVVFRENRIVELANHTAVISRHGKIVPIEDTAAPIRDSRGAITGAVLVFRDVTEARKAMEDRLYLAAIVDSSDDAIIGQTLDGRIASWNRGAERLYGYTAPEVIGKPLSVLVPPDHPDELPTLISRITRGEFIDHLETQRVRKDGSRVDVSLTISPVEDADGEIIGASKIARDITGRKEVERRQNEFLALLAHELRNPLAPIQNGLQLMELSADPEMIAEARSAMHRQVQHLVRLVDDLLDISRISRGKLTLRKERVSANQIVEHAMAICKPATETSGHGLVVNLPEQPAYLDADLTRTSQILCNLLSNAVKYSDPGTTISLSVEVADRNVLFRVKDSGIGIPCDLLPTVFDMFVQIERRVEQSRGGLGVGLAIVKRLAELHGGCVEAQSEGEGRGCEFIVRLPLASDETPPPRTTAGSAPMAPTVGPQRVLVVDDNVDAAKSTARLLKIMGHEAFVAHDGRSCIEIASEYRPDTIFLDIGMPELDGYQTASMIRAQPWGKAIRLIALTGWGQPEDRERTRDAGFDMHLVKPVDKERLVSALATERQ